MAKGKTISTPAWGTLKAASDAAFVVSDKNRTKIREQVKQKIKYQLQAALPYKLAKLSDSDPEDWFVYFSYLDTATGKYKRFKERHGLNGMHRLQEMAVQYKSTVETIRRTMAQEMIKVINENLRNGFNPFLQEQYRKAGTDQTVSELLDQLVEEMVSVATNSTKKTYRLMLSRFKKYLVAAKLTDYPAPLIVQDHAKAFQKYLQKDMKLAKKTVNASVAHLGLFWDELLEKKAVKDNPFRKVKALTDKDYKGLKKTSEEDDVFEPITNEELDKIIKTLKGWNQHDFIRFLSFIYYAWVRPVEISRLKVGDIDLDHGLIRIQKAQSKNKRGSFVQIVPELMEQLEDLNLKKLNKEWFLFSRTLKPGPVQIYDVWEQVTERYWHKVIQKHNIEKNMYALKHTGNIEYLLRNKGNVDLKWQQMQNRHSSSAMTDRYNRKLGAYFIDLKDVKFKSFK